jgi:hypothetical protein
MKKYKRLEKLAHIHFGLYQRTSAEVGLPYLQVSQFDASGRLRPEAGEHYLPATEENEAARLKPGQLILAGKGLRHFAWLYRPELGPMVASSSFFVIEPDPRRVLPEYLTVYLNMPRMKALYQTLGAGTNIPSIRKSELANVRILLPQLETQRQIVQLTRLHQQEISLMESLMAKKKALHHAAIHHLTQA